MTSEDARAYKPRPEPFRLALDRLGLCPGDVLHVGDSPASDVAGAQALVTRGRRRRQGPATPTMVVSSLLALVHDGAIDTAVPGLS